MSNTIHRIDVPNPYFEGSNSVYLIKSDPLTLIDSGVATDTAYGHLVQGLHAIGIAPNDIERVVLTHKHIDHIGNAWRFQRNGKAQIYIHASETTNLSDVDPAGKRFASLVRARMAEWRVPVEAQPRGIETQLPQWRLEACQPTALTSQLSMAGEPLQIIHTPGHTMGSVILKFGDAIFSGDHVLETISPNIGGGDMQSSGMLVRFLESLKKSAEFGDVEVYPGHGEPFRGLPQRCEELLAHHQRRLDETLLAVAEHPRSVFEVATQLFGRLRQFHVVLGCAEAHAHLEYLVDHGFAAEKNGHFLKV